MSIRLNAAATVALLVAVSVTVGMAKTKVKAQKDPNFDFSKLKTWAWNPSGPGDVKVWATKELTASVSGVATVDFWGSATVRRNDSGFTTWNDRGDKRAPP